MISSLSARSDSSSLRVEVTTGHHLEQRDATPAALQRQPQRLARRQVIRGLEHGLDRGVGLDAQAEQLDLAAAARARRQRDAGELEVVRELHGHRRQHLSQLERLLHQRRDLADQPHLGGARLRHPLGPPLTPSGRDHERAQPARDDHAEQADQTTRPPTAPRRVGPPPRPGSADRRRPRSAPASRRPLWPPARSLVLESSTVTLASSGV